VDFVAENILESESRSRWRAVGAPAVPALSGVGSASSIWHPSQAAALLGLPAPDPDDPIRAAWDLHAVLSAWIECVAPLNWQVLNRPTPSRGRTLRELTVNVFRPVELLPGACIEGRFYWIVAVDDALVTSLADAGSLLGYATRVAEGWGTFLAAADLDGERPVTSEKGELSVASLLDAQRLHAAYHLRQLLAFLEGAGIEPASRFRPEHIAGLTLPVAVF
jgi:hypothetical protein